MARPRYSSGGQARTIAKEKLIGLPTLLRAAWKSEKLQETSTILIKAFRQKRHKGNPMRKLSLVGISLTLLFGLTLGFAGWRAQAGGKLSARLTQIFSPSDFNQSGLRAAAAPPTVLEPALLPLARPVQRSLNPRVRRSLIQIRAAVVLAETTSTTVIGAPSI